MLLCALPLQANGVGIVAIVNGKAITSTMLENRIELVFSSSNIPDNTETRKRFSSQILDNLIDETLEKQEAENNNIIVTPDDMKRAIADLEQRNKMPAGSFEKSLSDRGINKDSALEQISARLLWQKLSLRKLRSRVNVSQTELKEGIEQFTRKQNRREYALSEIVLPILDNAKRSEIEAIATHIVGELNKGAEFGVFARQFSSSSTALQGGDAGWFPEERLDPEAVKILRNTPEGKVSEPIETADGIRIYKVNRRYDPKDIELEIKQLQLNAPITAEAPQAFVEAAKSLSGCSNVDEVADKLKTALSPQAAANFSKLDLGNIKLSDLAAEFRDDVAALNEGQVSPVLNKPDSLNIFVVCSRSTSNSAPPDEDKVREVISRDKLDLESRRYLGQLRRAAFIEKR